MERIFGFAVGLAIALAPTALALIGSARLAKTSVEEWRLLAWIPPAPLVLWWIYFLVAALRDPTSHNLWPFEMAFWALVTLALFGAFLIGRWLTRPPAGSARWRRRTAPPNEEL